MKKFKMKTNPRVWGVAAGVCVTCFVGLWPVAAALFTLMVGDLLSNVVINTAPVSE